MKSETDFFNLIDRSNPLPKDRVRLKRVKMVCTMGPACTKESVIRKLIQNGMDVARLNFSHGTHEEHLQMIKKLRQVARQEKKHLGILQDISGPKIRVGRFENGKTDLKRGQHFVITTENCLGDDERVSCSYKKLHQEIEVGHRILLDDGLIFLVVEKIKARDIHTRVVFGGILKNNKGVNLPDTRLSIDRLTAKDKKDIQFGLKHHVDFMALSFIAEAEDVRRAKRFIERISEAPLIISKIETRLAVHNIDDIISVSDGIMVARGDLGVECPLEKLPGLQKRMIRAANKQGKFVITATQMLESMIWNPRPTRAEASDVANAVLDGTDAVMLSAETASGKFPIEAARTMSRIIMRTEDYEASISDLQDHRLSEHTADVAQATTAAAVQTTKNLEAEAIVAFTHSGTTACHVSRLRPEPLIFALTPFDHICRRLSVRWGVIPAVIRKMKHTDEMPQLAKPILKRFGKWKRNSKIAMLSGTPVAKPGSTNLLKVLDVK